MSNNTQWITERIAEVKQLHPSVNTAVPVILEELLKGELSERQLTPKELKTYASYLIKIVTPASTKPEEKQ